MVCVPGAGYLSTPDDDPAFLYQDTLVALDADRGINIGEPTLHARCLDALALREGETVLHVGAGAGYYTALLAHLVGPTGRVHAYEIEPDLAARATQNLADKHWVEVLGCSGIANSLPKADAIYVNAGITQPSWAWLDALHLTRAVDLSAAADIGYGRNAQGNPPGVRSGLASQVHHSRQIDSVPRPAGPDTAAI